SARQGPDGVVEGTKFQAGAGGDFHETVGRNRVVGPELEGTGLNTGDSAVRVRARQSQGFRTLLDEVAGRRAGDDPVKVVITGDDGADAEPAISQGTGPGDAEAAAEQGADRGIEVVQVERGSGIHEHVLSAIDDVIASHAEGALPNFE